MMVVAKQVPIIALQIFFCAIAFAQRARIDSLKKVLPTLYDSARVDCLNALSEAYLKVNEPERPVQYRNIIGDTAANYAKLAYEEAVKINYTHGIAESLSYKGEIETFSQNFPVQERLSREAIDLYRRTANKKGIAEAYYILSHALYAESEFAEAIKNLDTAFYWYKKNGDTNGMFYTLTIAHWVYNAAGDYEKCFELARKCLDMAIQINNDSFKKDVSVEIAYLFAAIEDYEKALEYLRKVNGRGNAEIFIATGQYDSAKYYYSLIDTSDQRQLRSYLDITGKWYFAQKQYDKALPNFIRELNYHRQSNDINPVMETSREIAKTYLALGYDDSAFKYGTETYTIAKQKGAKQFIRDASKVLSEVYEHWRRPDSAYFYYRQYTTIKDSILNNVVKGKLAAYDFDRKMELINKEKQIQQVELQKQSLLKNIFIASIIVLLVIGIIVFRSIMVKRRNDKQLLQSKLELQKLESERTKSELLQKATHLEMQALRAQMNPHFIFNSLNSINRFILQNNRSQASEYLTKFSKLVRMILQNSQAALIPLESELESLNLYLDLEAVRFEHRFAYKISYPKDLDIEVLQVPPLVVQPFTENAIWHGLMHKEDKGQLDIDVSEEDDYLYIKITDNGIGRKKAAEIANKSATKHKSMGLRITKDRIAMLQKTNGAESPVKIIDLANEDGSSAGTEVIIKMPAIYD
jgi:tetratricopeptide (TPR) repeat protein